MQSVRDTSADGFSLIEVIVATGILTAGLLAMALSSHRDAPRVGSSPAIIAREKAREAVESVHTARDTGDLAWTKINNVAAGGVFLAGAQPMKIPGNDGLINTADDGPALESVRTPGPDHLIARRTTS